MTMKEKSHLQMSKTRKSNSQVTNSCQFRHAVNLERLKRKVFHFRKTREGWSRSEGEWSFEEGEAK